MSGNLAAVREMSGENLVMENVCCLLDAWDYIVVL